MTKHPIILSFLPLAALAAFAGPITTVPWNGHAGAVSFTYDDARPGQIPNLLPQLDALGIKATFFISTSGAGGDFEARKSQWIEVARKGHELANHTKSHVNVPADPNAAGVINEMARYLRELDPVVESVTFAYPYCDVNGRKAIDAENFISRGCGGTRYGWGSPPSDWMNVQGLILNSPGTGSALSAINSAKSDKTWLVTIIHDVTANPDAYSVTPADNKRMLDAAVAAGAWIDTYQTIAAYYRAHFVLDAATANSTSAGWLLAWTSPHPKMPKSVKMRVKLDPATFGTGYSIRQGGTPIPPEPDGTFVIDFMKLSLNVDRKSTGVLARAILPANLVARAGRDGILCEGVAGEVEATLTDVRGAQLFRGRVADGLVPLRTDRLHGILFLTLADRASGTSVRVRIPAIR